MMKKVFVLAAVVAAVIVSAPRVSAQRIKEVEFKNQAITDILLVLAESSGKSIVPDETVGGTASYYFKEMDFESALKIFLTTYKMYSWQEGGIYYVSRVRTDFDKASGRISLDAEDVEITPIVRNLSRAAARTILFDPLPKENLTVHADKMPMEKTLDMLIKRFPDYKLETGPDYNYIRRIDPAQRAAPAQAPQTGVSLAANGFYAVDVQRARLLDLLAEIFKKAGAEYSLMLRNDIIVENLHFAGKTFEELLRLVLEQANADFAVANRIYYVFDVQRNDVLKKLKNTVNIPLTYISVQDLPILLPQDPTAQGFIRYNKTTNSVLLTGSKQEIGSLEEFIHNIDKPLDGRDYFRFDLNYIKVTDLLAVMPAPYSTFRPVAVPGTNSFIIPILLQNKKDLEDYISLMDRKPEVYPVKLKYIQTDTLIKFLPPSAAKEDILLTNDQSMFFFTGSEDKRNRFLRELDVLDRPVPQIRYELLVVQYDGGENLNWSINLQNSLLSGGGDTTAFLGSIGNLLSLNFDIVSTFGYLFALKLNLDIAANKAHILADTTLNGLSGQELRFQNTNTSRYRDIQIDPQTNVATLTGVVREIVSGLIIVMNGWVSGDDMITMKVASTVSKQGAASSLDVGTLPSTSEKVVNTNVRTTSGQPVVIGGLIQQDKTQVVQKVPLLGDIPLLGLLFQSRSDTNNRTEMVIYILPRVEYPEARAMEPRQVIEDLYRRFVETRGT